MAQRLCFSLNRVGSGELRWIVIAPVDAGLPLGLNQNDPCVGERNRMFATANGLSASEGA
jgi:hypothetical protein